MSFLVFELCSQETTDIYRYKEDIKKLVASTPYGVKNWGNKGGSEKERVGVGELRSSFVALIHI